MKTVLIGHVPILLAKVAERIGAESDPDGHFLAYALVVDEDDPEDDFPPGHICSIVIEMVDRVESGICDECASNEEEARQNRIAAVDSEIRERALGLIGS